MKTLPVMVTHDGRGVGSRKSMKSFMVGDRIYDRWWPETVGQVTEVLKTRLRVDFGGYVSTYDNAHTQYLERYSQRAKNVDGSEIHPFDER